MEKVWIDDNTHAVFEQLESCKSESARQIEKWGKQERTPFEWLAFLTEEVGELAEAISEWYFRAGKPHEIRAEAIQVATLALKIADMAMVPLVGIPDDINAHNKALNEISKAFKTARSECHNGCNGNCFDCIDGIIEKLNRGIL